MSREKKSRSKYAHDNKGKSGTESQNPQKSRSKYQHNQVAERSKNPQTKVEEEQVVQEKPHKTKPKDSKELLGDSPVNEKQGGDLYEYIPQDRKSVNFDKLIDSSDDPSEKDEEVPGFIMDFVNDK